MRRTVATAARSGVTAGAHVSYPDRRGFGRYDLDLPPSQVTDDFLYQIGALDAFARAAGTRVSYVKPHGALYNRIAIDADLASAVVCAVREYDPGLALLTLPGSARHAGPSQTRSYLIVPGDRCGVAWRCRRAAVEDPGSTDGCEGPDGVGSLAGLVHQA